MTPQASRPKAEPALPWLLHQLVRLFVPAADRAVVMGDMLEMWTRRFGSRPRGITAYGWLVREVLSTAVAFSLSRFEPLHTRNRQTISSDGVSSALPGSGRRARRSSFSWYAALSRVFLDLRFALRRLTRRPGESLLAVAILATGLGATSAIFSVVRGVLLEPIDLPESEQLVVLWTTDEASGVSYNNSGPNLLDWQQRDDLFAGLFPYLSETVVISRDGKRERAEIARIGADAFAVVGLPMAAGRGFTAAEEGAGRPPTVVLDHAFWQRRFGGARDVLGTLLSVDGEPREVIGVAAAGFGLPQLGRRALYLPFDQPLDARGRDQVWLGAAARLQPDVGLERAQAALDSLHGSLIEAHPELAGSRVTLRSLHEDLVREVRAPLEALLAGAVFVLLLACANVANLLLARLVRRRGELAVRRALGGSRGRIVGQLVSENTLLAGVAAVAALGLVGLSRKLLAFAEPLGVPRLELVRLDLPVALFTVALALGAVMLLAGVPLTLISRTGVLSASRGADARRNRGVLPQILVVAQVALAAALLFGAGLLGRSLLGLVTMDPGFQPARVIAADLQLPSDAFADRESRREFWARLEASARDLPGVESAGVTLFPPLREMRVNYAVRLGGRDVPPVGQEPAADLGVATAGSFETLGIPLLAGRLFAAGDADRPPQVVINQAMADQLWQDGSPIGAQLGVLFSRDEPPVWHEVIGVVGNVKQTGLDAPDRSFFYLDMMQRAQPLASLLVRGRSTSDASFETAIAELVRTLDPRIPTPQLEALEGARQRSMARPRFIALAVSCLAGVALLIAFGGVFGVLAHQVEDCRGEIGIRMSLGARRGAVVGGLLGRSLISIAMGALIGLAMVMALARQFETFLFGVRATDPLTLLTIGLVLVVASLAASALPALRAVSVSPATALRKE